MVRVGGGWVALDEFLVKNDPCRGTYYFQSTNLFHFITNINFLEFKIIFQKKIFNNLFYHEYTHKIEDANHKKKKIIYLGMLIFFITTKNKTII